MCHEVRQVDSAARWRTSPLGHWQVLHRIRAQGHVISPLLQVPWIRTDCFRTDWLHCTDLGVAADFIGNVLHVVRDVVPGPSAAARVQVLSDMLLAWYERHQIQDRFDCLLVQLFEQRGKGHKMRGGAARVRAMVPWIHELCNMLLSPLDAYHGTIRAAAAALTHVYDTLREDTFVSLEIAKAQSTKFAVLFVACHDHVHHLDDRCWRLKPKLHQFLHLCCDGNRPARYWNYRDEEYGGGVARRARRQGGLLSATSVSRTVLKRFWIQHPRFSMNKRQRR